MVDGMDSTPKNNLFMCSPSNVNISLNFFSEKHPLLESLIIAIYIHIALIFLPMEIKFLLIRAVLKVK